MQLFPSNNYKEEKINKMNNISNGNINGGIQNMIWKPKTKRNIS